MNRRPGASVFLSGLCIAVATFLSSSSALYAQAPEATFEDVMNVSVFNLEVFVTDRDGKPITGLTADNFELLELPKKKIKPTYFSEITTAGEGDPLSLIVYVDDANLNPSHRDRALEEIAPTVRRLMEEHALDAMVITFDHQFRIVQPLTADAAAIEKALSSLQGTALVGDRLGPLHDATLSAAQTALKQSRGNLQDQRALMGQIDSLMQEFRMYGEQVHAELGATVDGISSLVRSLAPVPGRKAVLYVSDGLEMQPLDSLMKTLQRMFFGNAAGSGDIIESQGGQSGETGGGAVAGGTVASRDVTDSLQRLQQAVDPFNLQSEFQALADDANSYRVTFYPLRAPTDATTSAEKRAGSERRTMELSDMNESLLFMARATGGRALTSNGDVAGFVASLSDDWTHYYSLGLSPDKKSPGQLTPLQVKVKQRGARVRYRESYILKSLALRLAECTVGSLIVGSDLNPHQLEATKESEQATADGQYEVLLNVEFPIETMGLIERAAVHSASARLAVVVLGENAEILAAHQLEVPLEIPQDQLDEALGLYYKAGVQVRLPEGHHRLGLGFWDAVAVKGSFVNQDLLVGGD